MPGNLFPDLPLFALGGGKFLIDDRQVDWEAVRAEQQAKRAALGTGGAKNPPPAFNPPPGSLWLEITGVTNELAYLLLHGAQYGARYELLTKTNVMAPHWTPEKLFSGSGDPTPVQAPCNGRPILFFWAAQGNPLVSIFPLVDANEPPSTNTPPVRVGFFTLYREGETDSPLTVVYAIGGTATDDTDYTNLTGSVTFAVEEWETNIYIHPRWDNLLEKGTSR